MADLTIRWGDVSGVKRLENAMGRLDGPQKRIVLQRAVNHTGDKALTQVSRTLAKQTGLPYGVIKKALKVRKATGTGISRETGEIVSFTDASFNYTITARGGDIALKYFKARETKAGVTAAPFGKRTLFAGAFMKGGRFPGRVNAPSLHGHVFRRAGKGRNPIELQNSGVVIPAEMVSGASAKVFTETVETSLPTRVMHEIGYLIPGFFE
ncbi:phage tail protein [Agrobacterium vitis]|uniref:phage tail protein n=1 Tax=Agrobacterium vitis TaxID=373 RepID=UPI00192130A8|nr:phage tail protein [Agrobacterium vitis]